VHSEVAVGSASKTALNRRIGIWLLICAAMVYAMVVIGGITRLTRSGLSIVEWDPVVGTLPPLNNHAWQQTFDAYRQSPEFSYVNSGMTLDQFKSIFWWEYIHRLLGRTVGLVLLAPTAYLVLMRKIDSALTRRLLGLVALVGLEGALGWFMVSSGLVRQPRVSQYRLAAHLLTATAILGATCWVAWGQLDPRKARTDEAAPISRRVAFGSVALVVMMLGSGALVAGTRAGDGFNTFPLMNGRLVPNGLLALSPSWTNLTENLTTVQFQHRLLAFVVGAVALSLAAHALRHATKPTDRWVARALLVVVPGQITLGILTLLNHVPVALGSLHQASALMLFVLVLYLARGLCLDDGSASGVSGINRDDRAGHVAGSVGCQEDHDAGNLVGMSQTFHRDRQVGQSL